MGQFSREADVSKPTVSRWIQSGKISAEKQQDGGYLIDASELDRVSLLKERGNARNGNATRNVTPNETSYGTRYALPGVTPSVTHNITPELSTESPVQLHVEVEVLRERLKMRDEKIEDQKNRIHEYKKELEKQEVDTDHWRKQAERLLLTHKPSQEPSPTVTASTGQGNTPVPDAPKPDTPNVDSSSEPFPVTPYSVLVLVVMAVACITIGLFIEDTLH